VKPPGPGERLLYEQETPYQYARVVERPDGERLLELDEGQAVHSVYRPGSFLTGGYWDDSLVLSFATRSAPPRRIAILGDAAGSMARAYGHFFPRTRIDAVEIDGDVTAIGRRFFHLSAPHLRTITADARAFIRKPGPRYDAIILDAYRQPYIPFQLTTREFFEEVRERLTPGGVVLVNVGHPDAPSAQRWRRLHRRSRADRMADRPLAAQLRRGGPLIAGWRPRTSSARTRAATTHSARSRWVSTPDRTPVGEKHAFGS
jgi:spermidine synthase